jgi:putative ATP-dependent endonuclease of OLD family
LDCALWVDSAKLTLPAMRLSKIRIENFRGITDLTLDLGETTVLIGENNTGKTSVLEAVFTTLGRSSQGRRNFPFHDYDFHLKDADAVPAEAPPIQITLFLSESAASEWPDRVVQGLDQAVQVDGNSGINSVTYRLRARYDTVTKEFVAESEFLNANGQVLTKARSPGLVNALQQFAPAFFLAAIRDAGQHFNPRGTFWAPFARNPQLTEEQQEELEEQLGKINQQVVDAHKPFGEVKKSVAKAANMVPLAAKDAVTIEAVPARAFDLLSRTQVKLATRSTARLPVDRHGAGTQSLSVIFLFESFLKSRLAEAYDKDSTPILALEEPESHLHPSAVRALWDTLQSLNGQKIIATHSGELMAEVPLTSIRRVARRNGKVEQFSVPVGHLTADEEIDLTYVVRSERGALFFARCWLLVEGKTEYFLFPELGKHLGTRLGRAGVAVIEFAQCNLDALIKTAQKLGIEWHVLTDGDQAGKDYAKKARALLAGDAEKDRLTSLTEVDIEHHLWAAGFESAITAAAGKNQKAAIVKVTKGSTGYEDQMIWAAIKTCGKPGLARKIGEAVSQGTAIPASLKTLIAHLIKLCERQS